MTEQNARRNIGIGFLVGFLAGAFTSVGVVHSRIIPSIQQVQQGYIVPRDIKISCRDLDGNGELETLMKVEDREYLLRNVDGKPVISTYDFKPAEVIPKE